MVCLIAVTYLNNSVYKNIILVKRMNLDIRQNVDSSGHDSWSFTWRISPWLMEIYGRTEIKDGSQAQPKFLAVSILVN
jgi:hypothetical protein